MIIWTSTSTKPTAPAYCRGTCRRCRPDCSPADHISGQCCSRPHHAPPYAPGRYRPRSSRAYRRWSPRRVPGTGAWAGWSSFANPGTRGALQRKPARSTSAAPMWSPSCKLKPKPLLLNSFLSYLLKTLDFLWKNLLLYNLIEYLRWISILFMGVEICLNTWM